MGIKRRHEFIKCDCCKHNNDLTVILKNDDYERDLIRKNVIIVYCEQCGNCIEVDK